MARSTREFRRPHHRAVARALRAFDPAFLDSAGCFFGGGTQLAMTLGEYRESRDIDFLCAHQDGVRLLRETVTNKCLGSALRTPLDLVRDVRMDRDGIRTFLLVDDMTLKFEIVFEGRIELEGSLDRGLGVPVLTPPCAIAEKLLANADRGLDDSTSARDLIDLAFAAVRLGREPFDAGCSIAEQAYGAAVRRYLRAALDGFRRRTWAAQCIRSLVIDDEETLRKGLRLLRTWAGRAPS
jgi:hypothetical protein